MQVLKAGQGHSLARRLLLDLVAKKAAAMARVLIEASDDGGRTRGAEGRRNSLGLLSKRLESEEKENVWGYVGSRFSLIPCRREILRGAGHSHDSYPHLGE